MVSPFLRAIGPFFRALGILLYDLLLLTLIVVSAIGVLLVLSACSAHRLYCQEVGPGLLDARGGGEEFFPPITHPDETIQIGEVQAANGDVNPTPEQLALGRMLCFEKRLSTDGSRSCMSCHKPELAFTDSTPVSSGVMRNRVQRNRRGQIVNQISERGEGTRFTPTLFNAVFKPLQFDDGRAALLEGQATQPLVAANEMGQQSLSQAFGRLVGTGYEEEFRKAFGDESYSNQFRTYVNVQNGIRAISMFERTIVSGEAPIDRYAKGETWVFDKDQERGRMLFFSQGCTNCHYGKFFRDDDFHNILGRTIDRNGQLDRGRGGITNRQRDDFKFATPTLRELAKRGHYFHGGQASSLAAVVEILVNPPAGSELPRLQWSQYDKDCEVKFLQMAFESYSLPEIGEPSLPK